MESGDFIEIEFTGRVKGTGEVFDLTSAEEAKKPGIYNEKNRYGPAFVIVGAGMVVPGVEKQLLQMKPGEERRFELSPEEGFDQRPTELLTIVSISKFFEKKIIPYPGLFVDIDGMACRVQSVSGGRVRVDFNHPLAGKDLEYRVKVLRKIDSIKEKREKMLKNYGIKAEVSFSEKSAKKRTEKSFEPMKKFLTETIKKWIPQTETVEFEFLEEKKTEETAKTKKE